MGGYALISFLNAAVKHTHYYVISTSCSVLSAQIWDTTAYICVTKTPT